MISIILFVLPAFSDGPRESDPQPEFYFTRLMYTDTRGRGPLPGEPPPTDYQRGHGLGDRAAGYLGAWRTDTWDADFQYMWGVQRLTNIRLHMEPHPLSIMDPNLFKFPYVYTVEVGQMELRQEEADRMREYLLRGGFWHCDDFWGDNPYDRLGHSQWDQFARQIRKIFPDRKIVDLPLTHEVFHTFFDIDHLLQPPNDRNGQMYTRTNGQWPTWEQPGETDPKVRGVFDDHGRLMVFITYNSDFGDAWEWMDDPEYPSKFTTYAYQLGVNSIIYSMTH
jgi:hypothetical protein